MQRNRPRGRPQGPRVPTRREGFAGGGALKNQAKTMVKKAVKKNVPREGLRWTVPVVWEGRRCDVTLRGLAVEQRKENDVVMDDVVEGGRKAGLASLRRRGREGASSGGGCLERRGLGEEKTYRERGLRTVVCRSRREAWKGKCELGWSWRGEVWEMCLERRAV